MRLALASRIDRFLASTIDGILPFLAGVPFVLLAGITNLEVFVHLVYFVICALLFLQAYLLSTTGQSIGKKTMKIKIVRLDTRKKGSFITIVLIRTSLNFLLGIIVPFYSFIDALFIFGEDRRCIHDLIAGTCVIDA